MNDVFLGNLSMLSVPGQSHAGCGYLFQQISPPIPQGAQGLSRARQGFLFTAVHPPKTERALLPTPQKP